MKLVLSNPWRWTGTIGRGEYFAWGVLLFAVKFNLDRLLNFALFGRHWSIFDWEQLRLYLWQMVPTQAGEPQFLGMVAVSLPFLWAGVALTLRRLRAARWHPLWVVLFFAPMLKLLFFALLCLYSGRDDEADQRVPARKRRRPWPSAWIPRSALGSACFGMAVSLGAAVGSVGLGTTVLRDYGWSLFVGLPFLAPLLAVLIHCVHERRTKGSCLAVANGTIALAGVALLMFAMEGVVCLIMAAPLAFVVASSAGMAGYYIQKTLWWPEDTPRLLCVVVLAVPLLLTVEHILPPPLPLMAVRSSVVVEASPERVWEHVVAFSELPPPRELLFRLGVAYPLRAKIQGHGVGATRHCHFSTGPFVEPIEAWEQPRLLKFSVTSNPAPMQEWTPYRHVHPPHLDGFLESKSGQFRLEPLAGGRTLVEGTTWYHHHMWPASYWQVWSDYIIHTIHLRVLNHVRELAEDRRP